MAYFAVKNFKRFQHYRDRRPVWIKLYNDLLDDYEFAKLPDASKFHLVAIWLLASRSNNRVPADPKWIASKIGASGTVDLARLVSAGFITMYPDASKPLANGKQDASLETETETETDIPPVVPPLGGPTTPKKAVQIPSGWQPNDSHREMAASIGTDVADEAERFRDHAAATGRTLKDWDAGFRMWLRKSAEFSTSRPGRSAPKGKPPTFDYSNATNEWEDPT